MGPPGHRRVLDQQEVSGLDRVLGEQAAGEADVVAGVGRARLEQVRAALADGAVDAKDVVRRVYADVDRVLWSAAERSVRAQLDYLHETQALS